MLSFVFLFVRNKKYGQPEYDSLTLPHTYHRPGLLPDPIDDQYINLMAVARPLTYLAKEFRLNMYSNLQDDHGVKSRMRMKKKGSLKMIKMGMCIKIVTSTR